MKRAMADSSVFQAGEKCGHTRSDGKPLSPWNPDQHRAAIGKCDRGRTPPDKYRFCSESSSLRANHLVFWAELLPVMPNGPHLSIVSEQLVTHSLANRGNSEVAAMFRDLEISCSGKERARNYEAPYFSA
jgi:hypothetical protein